MDKARIIVKQTTLLLQLTYAILVLLLVAGMYRRPYSDVENEKSVPTIPVQPVSYGDIVNFMKEITEHECPKSWVGGLKISYSIAQPDDNMK